MTFSVAESAKKASYLMRRLSAAQRQKALETFARLLQDHQARLLQANQADIQEAETTGLSHSLYQRLKLDESKLQTLIQGIHDLIALPDPVGHVTLRTELDTGLMLERRSVPIGVIAVVFESRPDVIPQILSLLLKSGNVGLLKGGREALQTNQAFMQVIAELNTACGFLPDAWAQLLETREAFHALLSSPQWVDLVIPRGSNELVQSIQAATSIPVLGHADGVCHLYWHHSASLEQALPVILDAKTQYPAACNALETLLIDEALVPAMFAKFMAAAEAAGITLLGDPTLCVSYPSLASVSDWHTEYGDLRLAVKVVSSADAAIDHINTYGSHHTDGILATDQAVIDLFCQSVDSAGVYVNTSTRFADGYRYGFGAEVGISTSKTHARGPVGIEGLMSMQYTLVGNTHTVAPYSGDQAKPFLHHRQI